MEYSIDLSDRLLCDVELLLDGSFAPLTGFLNESDYKSVVENMRLTNGKLWPMPIVLPIDGVLKEKIKHEEYVILKNSYGLPIAKLYVQDIYKPDIKKECKKVYGSNDKNHPYVSIIKNLVKESNDLWYVGGPLEKINMPPHFDFQEDRMTPEQTKIFFADNGWNTVVGFQTRNPMHRSHLELTKYALKQVSKDYEHAKLLVQPIVGVTQECDIDYYTRVKCYKLIMNEYTEDTAKLSLLPLSMRMAGPREAMWHALIRKNYGCTHFIVGRDHAGPSSKKKNGESFYGPYDAHELLEKYKDEIGIEIVMSKMIVYVEDIQDYLPIDEVPEGMNVLNISGTEQRRMLRDGEKIPHWFTYPSIVDELRKSVVPLDKRGFCIYLIGLSGSGKSTIANTLKNKLQELVDRPISILDGDIVRKNLSKGLGFSREDRSTNVRRIGYVASEIVKHRGIAICSNIAPYEEDRLENRKLISGHGGYVEVYVNTPLETCEDRDVKGLYKLARQGVIKEFTGISDPFEKPEHSEIVLNDCKNLQGSIDTIINKLKELKYL
jgi:sulfate adenylyltransferase